MAAQANRPPGDAGRGLAENKQDENKRPRPQEKLIQEGVEPNPGPMGWNSTSTLRARDLESGAILFETINITAHNTSGALLRERDAHLVAFQEHRVVESQVEARQQIESLGKGCEVRDEVLPKYIHDQDTRGSSQYGRGFQANDILTTNQLVDNC